jgi:hypothetical protein
LNGISHGRVKQKEELKIKKIKKIKINKNKWIIVNVVGLVKTQIP